MSKKTKTRLTSFLAALPLAFVLIVFGLLPPRFDAVVYTDNVVGEGSCSSYLTDSNATFSYLYIGNAYFGSELKTLRMPDLKYNVEKVGLYIYDVEELDLVSYDICVFGRVVSHVSKNPLTHPYTVSRRDAVETGEEPLVHIVRQEGEECISVGFPGSTLIPRIVWIAYGALILLAAALLGLLLSLILERLPALERPLLGASALLLTMIMGCFLCGSLPYVDYIYFLLNWLLLLAAALFLNALTLPGLGTALVSVFTMVWYTANYFVIRFRSKPIMPADLKALGTAREVAGGYDLTPSWSMGLSAALVLVYLAALFLRGRNSRPQEPLPRKKALARRGLGAAAAVVLAVLGLNSSAFRQANSFQWDAKVLEGFHREGLVLTYVKSALSGRVSRPEGYSREAVASYLAEYRGESRTPEGVRPTRIIMIMNEAFSDLRTVGLDGAIDVMPFIDSLDENTVEGSLYVSVLGGGTCNTEFEALTGNSLAFLGAGAYPYTENVTGPLFSLAEYFRAGGYGTEAFHAGGAASWNRNMVYPFLGFDIFHSRETYPPLGEENWLHRYVTDATDYALIRQRDREGAEGPRFLFNVTIQNHADYDHFLDVPEAETLAPYRDSLPQSARVYLSMIKISDDAIRELMESYRDSEEPTMIIFFGDHQPMLRDEARKEVYTGAQYYLDSFQTKFFIWTNYETETAHGAALSANFLPWLILERGNFPLPPYVRMLKAVHEKYPIISSQGVVDAEGNVYDNVAMLLDDPLIRQYQYIQYANLFDELDPAWFAAE